MADKTLRTIGATVVLFVIAVAAILQMAPGGDPSAIALLPEDISTTESSAMQSTEADVTTSTTSPGPFVYRIGVLANATSDNFWAFYGAKSSVWDAYILGPTKAALYRYDEAIGTLIPDLAVSEAAPAQQSEKWVVRVRMREDRYWSDGTPLTAHDVVFTFETVRSLNLGGSWGAAFPNQVESISATSDAELLLSFSDRPTLEVWPHRPGLAPIMPKHIWSERVAGLKSSDDLYALDATGDVASGPLVLETIEEGLARAIKNPHHGNGPDVVEYKVYETQADAVGALSAGQIDTFLTPKGLAPDEAGTLRSTDAVEVEVNPSNGIRYLGFNLKRRPMADPAFRTALALLLDRPSLAAAVSAETSVANTFVRPANTAWFDEEAATAIESIYKGDLTQRLTKAVDGLRGAGYTWDTEPLIEEGIVVPGEGLLLDGASVSPLTILTPGDLYDPNRPEHAAAIAETLSWLGFDVRPVETDFDTVVDLAFTPGDDELLHYDMYLLGWTLGSSALPSYYRPLFASDGAMNNTGYSSEQFDAALAKYEGAYTSPEARSALWEMERILAQDLPYLLLHDSQIAEAYRTDRVAYRVESSLGGVQGRLGGIRDVTPIR